MKSRCLLIVTVILALTTTFADAADSGSRSRGAKYRIKIATLAPEGSAWMRTFNTMQDEILEATDGQVGLKAYPGGVLGEEKDVLFKVKVGQVDGGAFMGHGVGEICPDANAMMQPMQFRTYEEVDAVFESLRPHLEKKCLEEGYVALGWTEIGFSYAYSTVPVRSMEDLRGAKTWLLPGSTVVSELFRRGNVSGIPIPVGDVLTALQTGLVKTIFSPPLAAVAMQWFTRVDYRTDTKILYSFGGLFVSEKSWKKIPAELQGTVREIATRHSRELSQKVREDNQEALEVMAKQGVKLVELTEAGRKEFEDISLQVAQDKATRTYSDEAYDIVVKRLAELRGQGLE